MIELPRREIKINEAVRRDVPLLFGIFAIWDGGKTVSGIRVGRGMAEVLDPRGADNLHVIDTEANRALVYADSFRFKHVPLDPPHGSLDYLVAINRCVDAGAKVIMIDTVTHEHYGIGGYLDTIAAAQIALAQRWKSTLEKVKFSAINVAAEKRKELVRHVEQLGKAGVAMIFCFRASEKVKPRKKTDRKPGDGENSDDKMVEMGYMPDTKESLMFLMTASALLPPRGRGVPVWQPEKPGEKLMVKVPGYFDGIFRDGEQLNEEHGRRMAAYMKGTAAPSKSSATPQPTPDRAPASTPPAPSGGAAKPTADKLRELEAYMLRSTSVRMFDQRREKAETVALLASLDEETRFRTGVRLDELRDEVDRREREATQK